MSEVLKKHKMMIAGISVFFGLMILGYLAVSVYFMTRFLPNTWIYGVYATGRTADAVAAEANANIRYPDIRIVWADGKESIIDPAAIDLNVDLSKGIYNIKAKENAFLWPRAFFNSVYVGDEIDISYNSDKLRSEFEKLDIVLNERNNTPVYKIVFDSVEGYGVYDNHSARINLDKVLAVLNKKLSEGTTLLVLDESFYQDEPYTNEEKKLQSEWEELSDYLSTDIVYDMGAEKITFDSTVMSFLIVSSNGMPVRDDEGNYIIDDEAVEKWVDDLCTAYNTYGLDRQFKATNGNIVTIPAFYSTYGTELDHNAELRYLKDIIHSDSIRDGEPDVHVPKYVHEATFRGLNDIGDTYIEVDLSDQYMYYYKDGELILETDIVSGDIPKGWTTPRGVFAINGKYTDTYLYGRDYIDFVSYWMPYFRGYGLHDSDWRDEWGGDIYTYDGSHGCINMCKDAARTVFENIEIGTPVVVYDY
ncbi:MAG: L,D-transpeptidase [Lachnospiraceae bacterium]|nr:L,D-transpeptidase [Lachnospiraceae bacterium]